MRLPVFNSKDTYKRKIVGFGGINKLHNYTEGEMEDCEGISHEAFPALTPIKKMTSVFSCDFPRAVIFEKNKCVATESAFYYDGKKVGTLSGGEKTIVRMGSKIMIFPHKVYYDTFDEKLKLMEGSCNLSGVKLHFIGNKIEIVEDAYSEYSTVDILSLGNTKKIFKYTSAIVENGKITLTEPQIVTVKELSEGDIFSETSGSGQYRIVRGITQADDDNTSVLNDCVTVIKVTKDIFTDFSAGDIVVIDGCKNSQNNREVKLSEVADNYIMIDGEEFDEKTETSDITIKRNIPDFSCVCSYRNRLWGCVENTIYASALGSPLNFFKYENLSTDSFTVESDSPEEFTGATVFSNYCLFFKNNNCYRLYGDRPANFQLVEAFSGGMSAEDSESIACVEGKIFYKGNGGIYSFYGGAPQRISDKLGDLELKNCSAGGFLRYYYLSADTKNGREEFVYDVKYGMWSKSGVKNVTGYFSYGEQLYRLMSDGIYVISDETDDEIEWYAEFRPFDENYYKTKNYSRLQIKAELFENAGIKAEVSYDGGQWQQIGICYGNQKRYINMPCPVKKCHELKIRISGKGKCVLESIIREFSINQG